LEEQLEFFSALNRNKIYLWFTENESKTVLLEPPHGELNKNNGLELTFRQICIKGHTGSVENFTLTRSIASGSIFTFVTENFVKAKFASIPVNF